MHTRHLRPVPAVSPPAACVAPDLAALRAELHRALGIVGLAIRALREPADERATVDAWTALEAAHDAIEHIAEELDRAELLEAHGCR